MGFIHSTIRAAASCRGGIRTGLALVRRSLHPGGTVHVPPASTGPCRSSGAAGLWR
jgi:hypothetical protein